MRPASMLLLLAGLVLSAECIVVRPIQYGSLEVIGYDGWGGRSTVQEAELREIGTGRVLHRTRTGVFAKVREGSYALHAVVSGFKTARSEVYVSTGRTRVRVQMELGFECGPDAATLRGKVGPLDGAKDRWLKVTPLYGPGGVDVQIQPDGFFTAEGLQHGRHLLVVLEDGKPVHMQTVEARGQETVNVMLPPG